MHAPIPPSPNSRPLSSISNQELTQIFCTGPTIYEYGGSKVVQLFNDLVIKGGRCMSLGEAETQRFAASMGIPTPAVHRVFRTKLPNDRECWLMVMDFAQGQTLDSLWPSLEPDARVDMAKNVVSLVQQLESVPVPNKPPGPVGAASGELCKGPYFTLYGAGPFSSILDMQDWYNHKLDVCIRLSRQPPDTPLFKLEKLVLTHQDIAPRNIIIEEGTGRLILIDWSMGGIYPVGFEQAALSRQYGGCDDEFVHLVRAELPEGPDAMEKQLRAIMYALTTGWLL